MTAPLTLTLHGHACVRIVRTDDVVVIDPGAFSDTATALTGAAHVLLTHEHPDHVETSAVLGALAAGAQVWGPEPVVALLTQAGADPAAVHVVRAGDRLTLGGTDVRVLGERHEVIHPDVPVIANVAYLLDGSVLHPGDSFTLPPAGTDVRVLLEPVSAPWLRLADAVDHVRAVAPRCVVPIHDAPLSDVGRALVLRLLDQLTPAELVQPARGEPVTV